MTFIAPRALFFLLLVPVLVAAYVWIVRKRAVDEAELGTMAQSQTRAGKPLGRRRHVVAVLFLVGITALLFGLARPEADIDLPRREGTVVLAFDVSASMKAKDLAPSRIAAAKQAARAFVADQPSGIKIGVVAFNDAGFVVQTPTHSRADALAAIDRLSAKGGTALGRGILTSLGAVAGKPIAVDQQALKSGEQQPGVRFLGSAAVVLLSDGDNTGGLDPLQTAPIAAQAGVRIFPIGLGSADGAVVDVGGFQIATSLNAPLLRGIAQRSGGTYFPAQDAKALRRVYNTINLKLTVAGRKTEITAIVAGVGLVFFLLAAGLSMRWHGRVI